MGRSYRLGRKRSTVVVTSLMGKKIELQEGVSAAHQRLIYKGRILEECRTLSVYKIIKESRRDPALGGEWCSSLFLLLRMR